MHTTCSLLKVTCVHALCVHISYEESVCTCVPTLSPSWDVIQFSSSDIVLGVTCMINPLLFRSSYVCSCVLM